MKRGLVALGVLLTSCSLQSDTARGVAAGTRPAAHLAVGEHVVSMALLDQGFGWVTTTSGRVLWTADAGTGWRQLQLPDGVPAGYDRSSSSPYVHPFSADGVNWWLGWSGQLAKSSDGGAHWSLTGPAPDMNLAQTVPFFVSPVRGWVLIAPGSAKSGPTRLLGTSDGGTNWADLTAPGSGPFFFLGSGVGFMLVPTGGPGLLWSTADGGASWARVRFPDPPTGAVEFDFLPAYAGVRHALGGGIWGDFGSPSKTGLYVTDDGGLSWKFLASPAVALTARPAWLGGTSWLAVVPARVPLVQRTDDDGRHWRLIDSRGLDGSPEEIAFAGGHGWALSRGTYCPTPLDCELARHVLRSDDEGRTWRKVL